MKRHLRVQSNSVLMLVLIFVLALTVAGCKKESDKTYEEAFKAYTEGRYEDAIKGYKLAVSQGEKGSVIWADLALAYEKAGDEKAAFDAMEKALNQEPQNRLVLKRAGILSLNTGDSDSAYEYFEKALPSLQEKATRSDYETQAYMANILYDRGEYDRAVDLYNQLILVGYYPLEHEISAGLCYLKQGQFKAASQYFDMVASRKEKKPSHYIFIYRACMEAGDYERAATYFEYGKTLTGTGNDHEMTEGEYYARSGLLNSAIDKLSAENTTGALLTEAYVLTGKGEYEEAEKIYKELVVRGEQLPDVYCSYMSMKILEGQYDTAKQLLSQTLSYKDAKVTEVASWNEIILYEKMLDYRTAYEKLLEYRKNFGDSEPLLKEIRFLERVLK